MPSGLAKIGVETASAKPSGGPGPGAPGSKPRMAQGPPPDQIPEGADPSMIYGSKPAPGPEIRPYSRNL